MKTVIVAGGSFQEKTALTVIEPADYVIAADRGLLYLEKIGVRPDAIIGDFDSGRQEAYDLIRTRGWDAVELNPVKDDTDTEAALQLAFAQEGDIVILAGTGTRLDHVMGNISLLLQGHSKGRRVFLMDDHNRIRIAGPGDGFGPAEGPEETLCLSKEDQYGDFVSLIPYMGPAEVSIKGAAYPVDHCLFTGDNSLGVSNEIAGEQMEITVHRGYALIIESRD